MTNFSTEHKNSGAQHGDAAYRPTSYLKPLNPTYKTIEIDDNCTGIGVVEKVEIDLSSGNVQVSIER